MQNKIPLMTHEIGSLAKPRWRVHAMTGKPLTDEDLEDASTWGIRLRVPNYEKLLFLLSRRQGYSQEDKQEILEFSSIYGVRFLESAGIDLVWDGEQHRIEMYEFPIARSEGFRFHGHVRSFENKYYRKASCEEIPRCTHPYHLDEYLKIKSVASHEVKIPITGAYTLVDWSFDSYYLKELVPGMEDIEQKRLSSRKEFLRDLSLNVIYPNLKALQQAGVKYLQIDEPAATTKRGEVLLFIDAIKESVRDLAGKVFLSVHICYSEYSRLFPEIQELEGLLSEVHLEYANRDSLSLGRTRDARPGYSVLGQLKPTKFILGIGVIDIHTDFVESPELIRDRILFACDTIQDPFRIMVAPDCGLRTRSWEVAYLKLRNMVEGRNLALKELGF